MTEQEIRQWTERQNYLQRWKTENPFFLSFRDTYPEPDYFLQIGGTGTMPRGDICAIKAKAKNGKTTLIGTFVVALMTGSVGRITCHKSGVRVMYIDTEQNTSNTMANAVRWKRQAGMDTERDDDRLWVANIRTMPKEQRTKFIEEAVFNHNPDVVIIDGIRDLLGDFNDIDESGRLIETLMRWSSEYRINLVCVLHENKSKDDTNMRGHLGTELLNKCADVFEVRKDKRDKSHFFVEQTETRNSPVEDFAFRREADGSVTIEAGGRRVAYDVEAFKTILATVAKRFSDLQKEYCDATGVTERTASYHIKQAKSDEFLDCNNGLYYIKNK